MKGRLPEGGSSDAVPGGWAHQDGYSSLGGVPAGEADGNWVGGDEKAVSVIARGTVLEQSSITSTVSYGAPVLIPPGIGGFDF